MNYRIIFTKSVLKKLESIPNKIYLKIRQAFNMLKENPRPIGCKKLTNEEGYRIRVENYRILYTVDDKNIIVNIYKVGQRKDVYR